MKKQGILLIISIIVLSLIKNEPTYAFEKEVPFFPISFRIEMPSWEEVNKIIPKQSKFQIIDVETGKSFNVQRRAGSNHADVQPLTKKDTEIMKKVYNDQWSWRRRAVLVLVNDHLIAASMNGMPHGGGVLQNGFSGHFCIHFWGSTTHRSKNPDLSHQLMVLKAAGKIEEYFKKATPYELLNVFMVAINNTDDELLKMIFFQ
ncbi:hypothetical protein [Bacillus taeanensis]|uniref:Uncharacterized protein n=1 Tax=Bacillus taeanensis TaxID=273032 RepID=A0A366XZP4_9BACI|nr:hypothetical protein [Bacillus taeanensis]RBW69634.1 hypothetical protein DS031_10435 [Bacillus taeanensis]